MASHVFGTLFMWCLLGVASRQILRCRNRGVHDLKLLFCLCCCVCNGYITCCNYRIDVCKCVVTLLFVVLMFTTNSAHGWFHVCFSRGWRHVVDFVFCVCNSWWCCPICCRPRWWALAIRTCSSLVSCHSSLDVPTLCSSKLVVPRLVREDFTGPKPCFWKTPQSSKREKELLSMF